MPGGSKANKREVAVAALLSEKTIDAAAEKAGIDPRTLKRWLKQRGFQKAFRAARQQIVEAALARLQDASGRAVDTLKELLDCGHPPTQARAATAILLHSIRAVDVADVLARLEEMEAQLAKLAKKGTVADAHDAGETADDPVADGAAEAGPPEGGDGGGADGPDDGP